MTNPITPPPRVPPGHEAPSRLTVLLTLLGRHEFTPRWFAHAARELSGARVLVADGSHDDQAATLVAEAARAHGGLAVEYRRFAPDRGVADYQRKLATALAAVRTPYVMLADNDDFHIGEGVRHAVAALDARPELGTARGRVAHLVVRGAAGSLPFPIHARSAWAFDYEFFQPLDARRAEERLRAHGRRYAPSWYAVMRAPLAARWSAALAERPLADLGLIEWLQAAVCCASAPQLVGEWPFLFRQYNVTSKSSATALSRGDQLDAALAEGWSLEASRVIELSAELVAQHDGLPIEDARAAAHGALHDYLETRVLRQAFSRKGRRAADARWLASVAGGRLAQRYLAGSWYRAMAAAGLRTGPARGIERVLPALRGDATRS
jgi:glycosyltransferase domain-containing protein